YTRLGRNGVQQVDTAGLIAAVFLHRDTRAGDPDLHTHVAISNKVQTLDGRWHALDGRVLYRAAVSASERYNTRLEAHLSQRLGLRFADRSRRDDKNPVREIVGVDPLLNAYWSSRRAAIEAVAKELSSEFRERHGRHPDASEARRLFQQANLETRQRKHAPRSEAEQRAAWRRQAALVLGSDEAVRTMLERTIRSAHDRPIGAIDHRSSLAVNPARGLVTPAPAVVNPADSVEAMARQVIAAVAEKYGTWQVHHVRAEVERQVRRAGPDITTVDGLVDRVVAAALSPSVSIRLGVDDVGNEPAALRRLDGSSVFTVAGSQLYTCAEVVAAENRIVNSALRSDGRTIDNRMVEMAVLESAANGRALSEGQHDLVRTLATSGERVQLTLAPAGSGKTTALGVLSRAWTDGGGNVVGLAPSAVAATELRTSIEARTETVAKLLHDLSADTPPDWVQRIDTLSLVIVDEAGMVGTLDLDRVITLAMQRGASVRLVGDDRQLASVKTGGVLRDIARTAGSARLETVVRFTDPVEGVASLALRDGDSGALGYYLAHGRVHSGDAGSTLDQAYRAWSADCADGLDSILLAATREQVRQLNLRAQSDRLPDEAGAAVHLRDDTNAHVGDVIIARRNDRRLPLTASDWVKNGDRFRVDRVNPAGGLAVTHLGLNRHITLPAGYVADHVQLGYATTVHTAQGRTADTAHVVVSGRETRDALYVAMTRGRAANHVYVAAGSSGDPDLATTPDAVLPPTSVELLERIIAHEGVRPSAMTQLHTITDPSRRLREAIGRYDEALSHSRLPAGTGPGPLPWLVAPPQCPPGEEWGAYLSMRAGLIRDLAEEVAVRPAVHTSWSSKLAHADTRLGKEVAVWRAARDVPYDDERPTGPPVDDAAGYQRQLSRRVTAVIGDHDEPGGRWRPLADAIDPGVSAAAGWKRFAETLTRADAAGYDVPAHLPRLLAGARDRHGIDEARYRVYIDCPAAMPPPMQDFVPRRDDGASISRRSHDTANVYRPQNIHRGGPRI
ncbi:MAG: dnaG3, partial [Pseudonocardiales bacterium]|nr:dnaG3 [Pseudonocardiales bacterium]